MTDGDYQWKRKYIEKYIYIITLFARIFKAQMFGHTHGYEMHAFMLRETVVPLYVVGSMSPVYGSNPSFAVWEYDKITYEILDYHVFGTRGTENMQQGKWEHIFSATKSYGLDNLSKKQLKILSKRFDDHENELLAAEYQNNRYARSERRKHVYCKDAACRAIVACSSTWFTDIHELYKCQLEKSKYFMSKIPGMEPGKLKTLDVIKRLEAEMSTSRMLYPALKTGLTEKPVFNTLLTCAIASLTVLLLAIIILVLYKVFGIKSLSVKGIQTEKSKPMKVAP
ncbi:hypothetical protein ABG067_003284 [Albugo candida]